MNRRSLHTASRAFTLMELVMVMVVLGIVALAAAVPTLSYIATIRTRSAGARLLADVRYVQRYAMSARTRTWITLDVAGNRYRLYAEDPANPGKAGRKSLTHPLDQSTNAVQFGSGPFAGVTLSTANIAGTTEIEFDSFGVPYDGNGTALAANGTITLSNGVTVTLFPVSGLAEQAG